LARTTAGEQARASRKTRTSFKQFFLSLTPNVAFSCRRACGRLGTCLRLRPLNGSPLASVIGQLQRLVGPFRYVFHDYENNCPVVYGDLVHEPSFDFDVLPE
jgi:hypothetical protein